MTKQDNIYETTNIESCFARYFKENLWGSKESLSGRGSEISNTNIIRKNIISWLESNQNIKSIFDAPCGDFNWIKELLREKPLKYLGGDIVTDLIETNINSHSQFNFKRFDIVNDELPISDLWLCRDALIHFPFELGLCVVNNFKKSKIKYFLSTTFLDCDNSVDCSLGGYHKINLQIHPFCLGDPVTILPDPAENNQQDRFIGVWINKNL